MEKLLSIDGREVGFRANALTPRLYRHIIGRDIIQDLNKLKNNWKKANDGEKELNINDLEIFEDVAYIMARQYNNNVPRTADEWLEGFSVFSIYEIFPSIIELWEMNTSTTSTPAKK